MNGIVTSIILHPDDLKALRALSRSFEDAESRPRVAARSPEMFPLTLQQFVCYSSARHH